MCSSRFIKKSKKYKSDQGEQDFETEMKYFSEILRFKANPCQKQTSLHDMSPRKLSQPVH